MSTPQRLRIRRGPDILGTYTEFELAHMLATGEVSEFDVVSPSEDGDDWMPIRQYVQLMEQRDEDG